jgi:integrase
MQPQIETSIELAMPLAGVPLPFNTGILAGQGAPSTIRMYTRDFRAYLSFAGTPENAINPQTLARWRTFLSAHTLMSPNTINRMLSAVKTLMREAESQGYLAPGTGEAFHIVRGAKVAALKHRQRPHNRVKVTPAQMRLLTSLPDPLTLPGIRDSALLHTLASSGLRAEELATLTTNQITTPENGFQVRIMGKNNTQYRDAPLSSEAHEAILYWLKIRPVQSQYIFTSFAGRGNRLTDKHMSPVSLWRLVKAYAAEAGIADVKPHDFRRFVGTQLAAKDPRTAQLALGHKSINTTYQNYVLDNLAAGVTDDLY